MSYLLCCFYSPSLCLLLSYFWVTLNIFPQVFFFFFSLFRARETRSLTEALVYSWGPIRKGPLMCMNYLKATLFWISPHFGKYFQALPHKSLAVVVSGATPPGPIYKSERGHTWCPKSEQSYTLSQLFFWTFKAFIWCKVLHKCRWARSLILEQNSSHFGCRRYSSTYSKTLANTSICSYILEVSGPRRTNLHIAPPNVFTSFIWRCCLSGGKENNQDWRWMVEMLLATCLGLSRFRAVSESKKTTTVGWKLGGGNLTCQTVCDTEPAKKFFFEKWSVGDRKNKLSITG